MKTWTMKNYKWKLHIGLAMLSYFNTKTEKKKKTLPLLLNGSDLEGMATSQNLPDEGSEALQRQCVSVILPLMLC